MANFRSPARGLFILKTGAKLLFDPEFPPGYEKHGHFSVDSDGQQFLEIKEKYRNTKAEFIEESTTLVGPLDKDGRWPGVYADPSVVKVRFELDNAEHWLYMKDFIVLPGLNVRHEPPLAAEDRRLWDLPQLPFWGGDLVRIKPEHLQSLQREEKSLMLTGALRSVRCIFIGKEEHLVSYQVLETMDEFIARRKEHPDSYPRKEQSLINVWAYHLELEMRGPLWHLYNEPDKLVFASMEDEFMFWMQEGIRRVPKSIHELSTAYGNVAAAIANGEDILKFKPEDNANPPLYIGYKLHECFAQHRSRVRDLMERYYAAHKDLIPA